MWGLLLLFFMVVYGAIVITLLIKVKPLWGKGLVLIAAILIPNADDWYYRYKLENYCKNEAGVRVYQQASRQGGLLVEVTGDDQFYAKLYPIAFIESPDKVGAEIIGYWRTDMLSDGISKPYKIPKSTGLYEKKRIELKQDAFYQIKEQIIERKSGVVLGEFKGLFYYGSWYPRAIVGMGGLVAGCGKNGQVISHKDWERRDRTGYSINEVVQQIFTKE